jgi:thioredoxin 1
MEAFGVEPTKLLSMENFKQAILKGVALVDFTAPWCAPCREQAPIIQELAEYFTGKALIAEMNVDENQETALTLGIHSIPTLVIFKNGRETQRFVGLQSQNVLQTAVQKMLT